ncbi:MAG: sialate O-acetylesterase [Luteolibacter sp.]
MKNPLLLLAVAALVFSPASAETAVASGYDGPPERLHIYLLIGQSNMAGRAPITDAEKVVPPRTLLLNAENNWEPATHPFNQYSTIRKGLEMQKLGPGYNFAMVMSEAVPSITLGLIVNARGGSSIREWQRGQKAYQDALERARAAKSSGQLRGILWHQGESDQNDADYLAKLTELIANFRADLELPELPFVAGQVNNVPLINEQVARLPETVPHTRFVSAEGLTAYDRWHFDTASTLLLGKRYAEQMIELQKEAARR